MYIEEVKSGICDGKAFPTILKETPATAFIQGNNAIGMVQTCSSLIARSDTHNWLDLFQVTGQFCMDLAITKAKQVGVAWVNCVGELISTKYFQ